MRLWGILESFGTGFNDVFGLAADVVKISGKNEGYRFGR